MPSGVGVRVPPPARMPAPEGGQTLGVADDAVVFVLFGRPELVLTTGTARLPLEDVADADPLRRTCG